MAKELENLLTEMAERGERRGADALMTAARTELEPGMVKLAPETRRRRTWAVALGAATMVTVLIGGVALLWALSSSSPDAADVTPIGPEPAVPVVTVATEDPDPTAATPEPTSTTEASVPQPVVDANPDASAQVMDWTRFSLGVPGSVSAVIEGGPGLIAGGEADGDAAIWTTADGDEWTRVPHDEALFGGTGGIADLAGGEEGFVAVGGDGGGAIWFSPDGVSWERVPDSPVFADPWLSFDSVTYGAAGYVATGMDIAPRSEPSSTGFEFVLALWASLDGMSWDRVESDLIPETRMHDIAATPSGYLATGFYWTGNELDVGIWVSEDGREWSHHPDEPSYTRWGEIQAVEADAESAIATGYLDKEEGCPEDDYTVAIWLLVGTEWSRVTDAGEALCGGPGHAVTHSGDDIVIVGASGRWGSSGPFMAGAWVSRDGGTSWHRTVMPEDVFGRVSGNTSIEDVALFGDRYVAVGTFGNDATVWLGNWNDDFGS